MVGAGAHSSLFSEVHWDKRRMTGTDWNMRSYGQVQGGKNCHESGQNVELDTGEGVTSLLLMFGTCWTEP